MAFKDERRSLLASGAVIQVPWIKVEIGKYVFGVYSRRESASKDSDGFYYTNYNVQYPNYVKQLDITKINGQFNQYTLTLVYAVRQTDDPNFIEKVLSSVTNTRKIIFSYGDMNMPSYIYKKEEAIITKSSSKFNLQGGVITYTISAVSSAALNSGGNFTFIGGMKKPSDEIKAILKNANYGLQNLFTGMNENNIDSLIAGDDKVVQVRTKTNIAPIDYITYLVSCMIPASFTKTNSADADVYIITMHDDTTIDSNYVDEDNIKTIQGSYFKVRRVSYKTNKSDAFQLDIGFGNSGTLVTGFEITDDEYAALLYEYNDTIDIDPYIERLDKDGNLVRTWSPTITSKNDQFITRAEDISWWTKITKFPIKASLTVQGLLRPAILMSYLRINVIFPGGRKHIASGLYLVTQQRDSISESGYRTTLSLTKIDGDDSVTTY